MSCQSNILITDLSELGAVIGCCLYIFLMGLAAVIEQDRHDVSVIINIYNSSTIRSDSCRFDFGSSIMEACVAVSGI